MAADRRKATARLILKILKQIFLFGKLALPETSGCTMANV
jgi:hypothetical protein